MCIDCVGPQAHPERDRLINLPPVMTPRAPLNPSPPPGGARAVGVGRFRFACEGAFIGGPVNEQLGMQSHGAVAPDGSIYLLSRGERQLSVWTADGALVKLWDDMPLSIAPHGLHVDAAGDLWIADAYQHMALKYNVDGELLLSLGQPYVPALAHFGKPFNMPTGVATTPEGDVFVSDGYGNARVHKFDAEGNLTLSWGARGDKPGEFAVAHYIEHDAEARTLWVCDRENDRIQIFDEEGAFIAMIDRYHYPNDLVFDGEAAIIVHGGGVSVVDRSTREEICGWDHNAPYEGATRHPHGVFLDGNGDLYVTEAFGARQTTKFRRLPG